MDKRRGSGNRCSTLSSRYRPQTSGGDDVEWWGEGVGKEECNDAWRVGGWDIGAAFSNLLSSSHTSAGDTARGGGLISRGEAAAQASKNSL